MLKGVVQRYAPNVMMTKLDKINVSKFHIGAVPLFALEKSPYLLGPG